MHLEILSPENKIFEGEVNSVIFPGSNGKFQILNNHAPLISFLNKGEIIYDKNNKTEKLLISGGVVEIIKNKVSALIEVIPN
ncbi:MAG: ATP synthase F1 subunit epsilon [Flammeovirgaceae bacterium]|nr:ATP synthase F1 subunit epsilon [Flammeovirgaceae bacterium]|tara:strand:+ start:1684 stop:1929 length:246 start_codon:yes stop_codon:yes gene_type:complete